MGYHARTFTGVLHPSPRRYQTVGLPSLIKINLKREICNGNTKEYTCTKVVWKINIKNPENICQAFFHPLVAVLLHNFIYF